MNRILLIFLAALALTAVSPSPAEASAVAEIIDFDAQEPSISVQGSSIRVADANGMTLFIYNVAGVCVMQLKVEGMDKTFDLNLPKGCYILKVGKVVRKISVK